MAVNCVTSVHVIDLRSRREVDGEDGRPKILHTVTNVKTTGSLTKKWNRAQADDVVGFSQCLL